MAVWVLLKHTAAERKSPHWTAAVTQRKVVTLNTVARNYQSRSLDEFAPRAALREHSSETIGLVNVAKEIVGIARDPAVALRDKSSGVD